MSIASRHGKLHVAADDDGTRHRRLEDLLTADVFGAYRYMPPTIGVLPLLESATDADGSTLRSWAEACGIAWDALNRVRIAFWPSIGGREPDVLIAISGSDETCLLVLVEAKLHSDQHEIEGRSQIGFYGELLFDDELMDEVVEDGELPVHRPIVFLTKAAEAPIGALNRARGELAELIDEERTEIFWTNWHQAQGLASTALEKDAPPHVTALLSDLLEDLSERGFRPPRERLHWPLPRLEPLRSEEAEPWLRASFAPERSGPSMAVFQSAQLGAAEGFLRQWRLR